MVKNILPSWNLKDLYQDISDPQIDKDVKNAQIQAQEFEKKYRGKIEKVAKNPKELLKALVAYEKILWLSQKPIEFSELIFAQDSNDPKNGAFLQKSKASYLSIYQTLLFFDLGLTHLDEKVLKSLTTNKELTNYRHFLQRLLDYKPHRLSEAEEKILNDKSLTGRQAFVRLFDQELAKKQFKIKYKSKIKTLTESELLDLLYETNRNTRKLAAQTLTQGLGEELDRLTYITNILIEDKQVNDRYAKFANPEDSRHLDNEIDPKIVATMVAVVTKNYPIVQDYYKFKKSLLRLKTLEAYDVYAPVAKSTKMYSFEKAQEIVLTSFAKFSPKYKEEAQEFFDKRWIDVPPRQGKRGGAFCNYGLPGIHPYILLNYTGTIREVLTLAHELGHGVHARFFKNQTLLNFDTPLTIAETSSVFAEMLVFDNLKDKITNRQEKLSFYLSKIEDTFATVFRQTGMYQFEQRLHKVRREKGELTSPEIGDIWLETRREMFADSVHLDQDSASWWSYIPHFIHTPFYVYAYAFGELLTLSLYAKYKKEGKPFGQKYIEFLSAGGSKSPEELLTPLGVNLEDPQFWQGGIDAIKSLVEEAKALS